MEFKGIRLSDLKKEEVLFFIRIRGKASYFKNVYSLKFIELFQSIREHRCISEYKKNADVHINLNDIERGYLYEDEFNKFSALTSLEEVIKRCRGLREIPYVEASALVYKAYLFFDRMYTAMPDLKIIVTGAIDNYVMDLMVRVGESKGIRFMGVTGSLMSPEYNLITVRGECNDVGQVDSAEVTCFSQKIITNTESRRVPKIKEVLFRGARSLLSYYWRFTVRYLIRYKLMGNLGYEYRFAPYLQGFYSMNQLLALRFLEGEAALKKKTSKLKAYIPLHWYPEATTDYWVNSLYHVDYLSSVMNTIVTLQKKGYEVFAKEHPHFLLSRKSVFYEQLKNNGCTVLSPFVSTKEVFNQVDLVVVWNGSTGIEALLDGKKVLKVVNSYYGDDLVGDLNLNNDNVDSVNIADKCLEKVYRSSFRTR